MIPCDHTTAPYNCESHAIYSDDHGGTWMHGKPTGPGGNECQVVELANGALMLNMRMQTHSEGCRGVAISTDGGETWGATRQEKALPCCTCMGSFVRYGINAEGVHGPLLFSNPASATARVKLTVRASFDEGATWPAATTATTSPLMLNMGPPELPALMAASICTLPAPNHV